MTINKHNIILHATSLLNTKFRKYGRNQYGCDCFGVIIYLSNQLNLRSKNQQYLSNYDVKDYSLASNNKQIEDFFNTHLYKISNHSIDYGDVALLDIDKNRLHMAIIGKYPIDKNHFSIIHASCTTKTIIEQRLDSLTKKKIKHIYRFAELY